MTRHKPKGGTPEPRPAWTPFELAQEVTDEGGTPGHIWVNSLYTVISAHGDGIIHLSIRNNDRSARHDWREFQRIKNEIVGPENEAMEIYPAESRLLDTANQFHLWVFKDPSHRIPLGWTRRLVADYSVSKSRARQRPFRPSERPPDAMTEKELTALGDELTKPQESA
jgi:hypothetical protein